MTELGAVKARIRTAANNLLVDTWIVEVTTELARAGLRAVVLKGPAVARWIYPNAADRIYIDCDLLVDPERIDEVSTVLSLLGFEPQTASVGPLDRPRHAETWRRATDGALVDLHQTLIGVGVGPKVIWQALGERAEVMRLGNSEILVLDPAARCLHIALHAAQHGIELPKTFADLNEALLVLPQFLWMRARALALQLDASEAFSAGLRMLPEGAALAHQMDLPVPTSTEVILRSSGAPHLSLGFDWVARVPGFRAKLGFIVRKLWPPPQVMRTIYPAARGGVAALCRAYVTRLLWMSRQAPRGFLAWWRARAESRRGKPFL